MIAEQDFSYNFTNRNILLTGDINSAVSDITSIGGEHIRICPDLYDAIVAVEDEDFDVIGVVIPDNRGVLNPVLKTLRENSNAKIILLAKMYEEPIAVRLVNSSDNGIPMADDYLIYPLEILSLLKFCFPSLSTGGKESPHIEHQGFDAHAAGLKDSEIKAQELAQKIRELEKLATEDDLTGLKNRRYIWEFSRQIIQYARTENRKVTLLIFDIDNFKNYNDLYGHGAGDEILRQAAILMRRCCRAHDIVGRIGGDEFAVVFWETGAADTETNPPNQERRTASADHPTEAISIAKRLVKELEKARVPIGDKGNIGLGPGGLGVLTISGGLASFPADGSTAEELFRQADEALLEAKRSGKNRIYLVGSPGNGINEA